MADGPQTDADAPIWQVEVRPLRGGDDARAAALLRDAAALGIGALRGATFCDLYFIQGPDLSEASVARLTTHLLCDPVIASARWRPLTSAAPPREEGTRTVEITPRPGVTDTVADQLVRAARAAGLADLGRASSGLRVCLRGGLRNDEIVRLTRELLANEVVQAWRLDGPLPPPFMDPGPASGQVETLPVREADDPALLALSASRRLSLDLAEMRAIQTHFREAGRDPTDLELEMLAQTWSEHCVHKTFRAIIDHREYANDMGAAPRETAHQRIDSLYDTCIRAPALALHKPWLRSAFEDNAGVIAFDDRFDLAFKVETHNHPSALDPFGGANTGVGGVIRDILGVSASPIACTDVLCFGPQDLSREALPAGVLHPRQVAAGVIAGVGDYGNKMGIPTVNGAVLFDPGYTANPLVYCGCLGIAPRGSHRRDPRPGDRVVCIGGRTGRDGLRGATFSSMEMGVQTSEVAGASVQIGHPFVEKQVWEVVRAARDLGLYHGITDCGAGGLSSAVGEMAAALGAQVHLERVPLKYAGLQPWEVWLSEAQERMVLAVPPLAWPRLLELCADHGVEASDLGEFTGDGTLRVLHEGRVVGDLPTNLLHHGIPRKNLVSNWFQPSETRPILPAVSELGADVLALLATPEVRSKEDVVRRYDHEVQGGTVVKPLVGPRGQGPGDAAVLLPLATVERAPPGSRPHRGVALAVGIQPALGRLDPYRMAWASVDEAMRNLVCVGADPDQVALLDNFCWGNPDKPDRLGALVRCALGCRDAALAYGAPFISGKDSLNNEYADAEGKRHAIPGTLLVSAVGIVPDVRRTATMDLKRPGHALYALGETRDEVGASLWLRSRGLDGGRVPAPTQRPLELMRALHRAIEGGLVAACHDCSEGGFAVALAEMALAGGLGAQVDLSRLPRPPGLDQAAILAFSESLGRFVVEVPAAHCAAFERALSGLACAQVGTVQTLPEVALRGPDGAHATLTLDAIERAFRGHLRAP